MSQMPHFTELEQRRRQRAEALALHAVEGITFSAEDIAFAEQLDRQGLNDEDRIEAIKARFVQENINAAE
ncbi:MAG: hypothetical protein AAFV59_17945 [Pseudomonadota bacterium]